MYAEQFRQRKALAIYWHNKATDLRGSAGALWATMLHDQTSKTAEELGLGRGFSFTVACWPVYQMLCGMALELLLKAVLVACGKTPEATHSLVALCERAGLALRCDETDVLQLLSGSIVWEGRYPVPKTERTFAEDAELRTKVMFDEVPVGALKILRGNDALSWEHFQQLWRKFDEAYDAAFTA